jgi:hypothetical protein
MDEKRFFRWCLILVAVAVFAVACDLTGGETPPAVEPPTAEPTTTTAETEPTLEPTVLVPTAAVPAATATLPGESEPETEAPTPTLETAEPEPTTAVTVTETATLEPVAAAPGQIAPGQQTNGTLADGGVQLYNFEGVKFEQVVAFVEGDSGLDLALSAYQGDVGPGTDLGQFQPISQGDFSGPGLPEILVVTPEVDGTFTLAVQGNDTVGDFTLYMYDGTIPTANTRLVPDSLAAGETRNYKAISNGGRPVIIFVDPSDQSDVVLEVQFESGEQITEADFGGNGSVETAFVLPRTDTAYTILVSTADGGAATYNLVIVTLD